MFHLKGRLNMRLLKASSLLLLVACGQTGTAATQKEVSNIEYYKDTRTNLCFVRNTVTNSNGFSHNVFSNVPCSDAVEKLIPHEEK